MQTAGMQDLTGDGMTPPEMIFLQYQALHVPLRAMTIGWQTAATFATGMLGFTAERLIENQKTLQGLLASWDWNAAEAAQQAWLETAVRQYQEVGQAASRLNADAANRLVAGASDVWTLPAADEVPVAAALAAAGSEALPEAHSSPSQSSLSPSPDKTEQPE
ncbi:hypothetical protein [Jiella sp. M17.18]|uniref:hypothetical protein n=1 Tax=Jiella sp. M17.18 TaxID=3234247 RepID=UPI0034E02CAC